MYGNVAPDDSIISLVNGIGALTGQTVNLQQDSVLKSMDEIAKAIKSLDKNKLNQLITTFGVDRSLVELFNNNKYAQARKTGDAYARQTEALQERNANLKLALTASQTGLKNQVDIFGETFTPVLVKLNEIGADLLKEINKYEPDFEKALPKLEKLGKDLINWLANITDSLKEKGMFGISYDENDADERTRKYLSSHPNLSDGEKDEIIRESRKLVNIDSEKGDVVTKDSHGERSYNKNDFFNARPKYLTDYFDYLVDEKRNNISNKFNKPLVSKEKVNDIIGDPIKVKKETIEQHNIDAQYRNTQVPSNNSMTNINVNEVNINGQQIDTMDKLVDQVSQRATTVTGISHAQAFNSLTNTV